MNLPYFRSDILMNTSGGRSNNRELVCFVLSWGVWLLTKLQAWSSWSKLEAEGSLLKMSFMNMQQGCTNPVFLRTYREIGNHYCHTFMKALKQTQTVLIKKPTALSSERRKDRMTYHYCLTTRHHCFLPSHSSQSTRHINSKNAFLLCSPKTEHSANY